MTIAIVPLNTWPTQATQLQVDDGHVTLGVGANFQYALLDANGALVSAPARNTLTDEQYASWTGSDEAVCAFVAQNVGLTPA